MLLWTVASGCVPAAVYGIRFDGGVPQATELAVVGGAFPGSVGEGSTLADTTVVGLQGRQRVGGDVALAFAAGVATGTLDGNAVGAAEIEVQGRVLREAPVTLSVLGGVDGFAQEGGESILLGVHAGAVVSRAIGGDVRPFFGVKVNPVLNVGEVVYPWLQYGGGVSWRPRLAPATRGLLALEASGYRGFGADLVAEADIVTWGAMLQVGASFGNEDREP
jgi:hypothetical protein